jgi:hypothetical protein
VTKRRNYRGSAVGVVPGGVLCSGVLEKQTQWRKVGRQAGVRARVKGAMVSVIARGRLWSCVCALVRVCACARTSIRPFVHSFIRSFVHSSIRPFVLLFYRSCVRSFGCSCMRT